jgi:Domain of unknown function (DUF4260)
MTATNTTFASATAAATRSPEAGMTQSAVRAWLRLEGLAAFGAGLALFGANDGNWLFLVPLLLLPDLSMIGYLAGPRIGAFAYNTVHNWAPGMALLGIGTWFASPTILLVAAVLIAHVGMDRAAGFGLKLPGSFGDTHLGRMGRSKQ